MSTRNIFRVLNQNALLPMILSRSYAGGYKAIKRPDLNKLKMPTVVNPASIWDILKGKIELNGPITVAEYMNIVITNPTEGYYMKKEIIGEGGDFITSPEISQLFGEMIGIWFYSESRKLGPCVPLQIVELGPGKGTLITDILRVATRLGLNSNDISIHLVEISSVMQSVQASRLCMSHGASDDDKPYNYEGVTVAGSKVYWYDDISKVPSGFSWFIAHEFFDVLPIHKFQKTKEGWREILIGLDKEDNLEYIMSSKESSPQHLLLRPPITGDKEHIEISPKSLAIAKQLAERVDRDGGIALIADYGHEGDKGDTFRAFHKHQLVDPLKNPGIHDLTADVDFSHLRLAASETAKDENFALVIGPVTQMDFLKRSQAEARLQVLVDNTQDEDSKEKLKSAYDMLTNPKKMGERFKFMAFYPSAMASLIEKYKPLGFSL